MATILVADDNSNIQKMVGLALKDHGIDVVAVGNGEAAVRRIPDVHPDLILADIFMPVKNGYEVCEFVKKNPQYSHIPVILLVGAFDPLDEREAQRVGADGVLKKPFIPPDPLISMVKAALARATSSRHIAPVPVPQPVLAAVAHSEPVVAVEQPVSVKPAAVSFGEANRPLAFGSLLETEEMESEADQAYVAPVPHPELSDSRNWGVTPAEEEVEEEEEPQTSWRADAVPDELLTSADEQPSERSPYADAAITDKEDVGISTGVISAAPVITEVSQHAEPAAPIETGFFAPEQPAEDHAFQKEATQIESLDPSLKGEGVTQVEQEAQSSRDSETPASKGASITEQQTQSAHQADATQRQDYETVFTPDAFPGLFIEEKPPTALELSGEPLQDAPSAFFELPTGVSEPEATLAGANLSESKRFDSSVLETQLPEAQHSQNPIPSKLPTLWEEQVRQAARLIASTWPNPNEAAAPSNQQSASSHLEPFASEPFSTESSSEEPHRVPSEDELQNHEDRKPGSPTLERTPAYNSWLTKQGQQLLSSNIGFLTEPAAEEPRSVQLHAEANASGQDEGAVHEHIAPSESIGESIEKTSHNGSSKSEPSSETGPASLYLADYYANRLAEAESSAPETGSAGTESPVVDLPAHVATASAPDPKDSLADSTVSAGVADHRVAHEPPTPSAAKELREGAATASAMPSTSTPAAPADFEAVVAQVLARMNPEMFQSMTQQLLKPVIEAIVRSELEKKQ